MPFPSDVSMLWNLWRDPHPSVPLVQLRPRYERCMWWTNRNGFDISRHGKACARIRSTPLFTSWDCQSDLCHVISLLHDDRSATISMDWLLFDQWNTSAAYQLTSDLNKQQTSILLSSRKSVTEERISMKYICNLIKQFAKISGRQKWLF